MIVVIYSTFPDIESAQNIGRHLIKEKLAVCSNIYPIKSQYMWQGEIQEDDEFAALYKTSKSKLDSALQYIKTHHPYEIPIITHREQSINKSYGDWMEDCLK